MEFIMNEKEIYIDSILTFAFTNDGQIIVRKDKDGKIDTLPWFFIGYYEKGININYEDNIWVMNGMNELKYKEKIATFFSYHLRNSRKSILNGFLVGNRNYLLDVGELHEKIANRQIEEMKTIHTPSYIRVNRNLYDSGISQNGQPVINRIETRYVVLPSDETIESFPELEVKNLDELRKNLHLLSDKILLGITGKDGRIMDFFMNQIKLLNRNDYQKKL